MNQSFINGQNFYELRKTIRFVLDPKTLKRPYTPSSDEVNLEEQLNNFIEKYQQGINDFKYIVYFGPKTAETKELNKKISIKHSWLRNYTKSEFYSIKDKLIQLDYNGNKASIGNSNLKFLNEYFENWISENQECADALKNCINAPAEKQKRKSEAAHWVRKLTKRSNFECIFELFNGNIDHKNSNDDIEKIKHCLNECKTLLTSLEKMLLPSQSLGMEIERASLNYYTINKKPKNYDEDIAQKASALNEAYQFKADDKAFLNRVGFSDDGVPINELKEAMKKFKADQKSKFYEFVNQKKSYSDLKKNDDLKLLNDISEEDFNKFKETQDKMTRGKHFQFSFPNYKKSEKNFCDLYKNVAVAFGKIRADIKALEKERMDAEKLQCWAVILEKDNQRYVVTIPRDANNNLTNTKQYIDNLQNEENDQWILYAFESLTLRSLDKLCFGLDKNTFIPAITGELYQKNNSFFEKGLLKRKDQFSQNGTDLAAFYKTVLELDSTKKMLGINKYADFKAFISKEYTALEDFEKTLKETCYFKKRVFISEDTKNKLINDYQGNLYKITSYDLEKDDSEALGTLINKKQFNRASPEIHTKTWLDFWTADNETDKYPIRLNPEFKISFVEKQDKDLNMRNLGLLNKNRRLKSQFLLSTTITLLAHEKNADLHFKKTDEIQTFINSYNQEFNKKIKPFDIYYYGLDRGQKELLTLGLFKFSENEKVSFTKQDGTVGEYSKPKFIPLDVYQIREGQYLTKNKKGRLAYKSIDQFIDDEKVIEKLPVNSCLDLSCAKLVKGKIIQNGDVATYLELKRVSALRKIYENTTRGQFKTDRIGFNKDKGCLFLDIENRGKLENNNLYFYDNRFAEILSLDSIIKELQDYYNEVKNKQNIEFISIDKINHLRDALCANAVGILAHLQKTHFGVIVFEGLDARHKNKETTEFAGNLASRIERKILQKLETLSLIPPQHRQIIDLQNSKQIKQTGAVLYIEEKGTSANCPHCETANPDKSEKWLAHNYKCKNSNCNFDASEISKRKDLIGLDNSDSVATYNIAKRGLLEMNQKIEQSKV
jgi:hypothetical protein